MNIHEYQAKELLKRYGVTVLDGHVAWTPEEAEAAARKASRAGVCGEVADPRRRPRRRPFRRRPERQGRRAPRALADEVKAAAEAMIGHTLVTKQTGPAGRPVHRVYVEAGCDIARELYLSLLVDRVSGRVTIIASTEGGMEIEEVAAKHPEKILRVGVDPASGISGFHGRRLAFGLGLTGKQVAAFGKFVAGDVSRVHRSGLRDRSRSIRWSSPAAARSSRWMPRSASTTTRCSATPNWKSCAMRRKKTRRNWKPPNSS